MKASFVFASLLASLSFSSAAESAPPACLLAVLGSNPNPSDLKSVCADNKSLVSAIQDVCHTADVHGAYAQFQAVCHGVGVKVAALKKAASPTGSATSDASGAQSTGSTSDDSSSSKSSSNNDDDKDNAAAGLAPSIFVALTGLVAVSLL